MTDADKMVQPKSSKVWEHFTLHKTKRNCVTCKLCKSDLTWHGSSTVMIGHLKQKHVGVIEEDEGSLTAG